MPPQREFDIVLVGASGYTGALVAEQLAVTPGSLRWAVAGRRRFELEALAAQLAPARPAIRTLDILDEAAVSRLAASTRVVLSTAGPYLEKGLPLVRACAEAGTDYADICGEAEFIDRCWLACDTAARKSGARIVHACGFESLIADYGARLATRDLNPADAISVRGYVQVKAQFSRGTPLHSLLQALARGAPRRAARRERRGREQRPSGREILGGGAGPHRSRHPQGWALPLPGIDVDVVRRTAAGDPCYGHRFSYAHYLCPPSMTQATALAGGGALLWAAAQWPWARQKLLEWQPPGSGPTAAQRAQGRFTACFVARAGVRESRLVLSGGDPGYTVTSHLLAASGLCLAFDPPAAGGGCLTPVQALGEAMLPRLLAAGIGIDHIQTAAHQRRVAAV